MEHLGELPPAALIPFGIVLAFIFAARFLGLWQGQNAPPDKAQSAAQVAAVIVDPKALNRLSDEVATLTAVLQQMQETGEGMAKSEAHMAIELDRIREELRIQREIHRSR